MIDYRQEIEAFWRKYKDVETDDEWMSLIENIPKIKPHDDNAANLLAKCMGSIESRYKNKLSQTTEDKPK